jgi:hypothetical protein
MLQNESHDFESLLLDLSNCRAYLEEYGFSLSHTGLLQKKGEILRAAAELRKPIEEILRVETDSGGPAIDVRCSGASRMRAYTDAIRRVDQEIKLVLAIEIPEISYILR